MLDFAIRVAQDAGRLLRDRVGTTIEIGHKGTIDLVTDVDLASERLIREAIASHYPRHQVLGEEGGLDDSNSDYRWVVDPLDGTTNFAHGFPVFAVSIALEYKGETMIGVVYDPTRDELFAAERGAGATPNCRPISLDNSVRWRASSGEIRSRWWTRLRRVASRRLLWLAFNPAVFPERSSLTGVSNVSRARLCYIWSGNG